MDIGSCHVPHELLLSAFSFLKTRDIKATRLVCKIFNVAASSFLIRSAWISTQPSDWKVLEAISQHDIISRGVREIIYDTSYYDEQDAHTLDDYWCSLDAGNYNGKRRQKPTSKYSELSILRGYNIYLERLYWQQRLLDTDLGEGLTDLASANVHQSRSDTAANDLSHLTRALEQMPGIETLSASCRRYQHRCLRYESHHVGSARCEHRECRYRRQRHYSLENKHDENAKAVVLHPRPFILSRGLLVDKNPAWDRALVVIDLACNATNKIQKNLRNCSLDVLGGRWNYYDSEDALNLPNKPWAYKPVSTACITRISLNLVTIGYMSRFMETDGNGSMRIFLSAMPNIVELKLATDPIIDRGFVDLENILGIHSWRYLRNLRLKGVGVLQDQFVDLMLRHRSSLVLVETCFVGLVTRSEFLKPPISQTFDLPVWEEVLGCMAILNLDSLLIKSIWDTAYALRREKRRGEDCPSMLWYSDNRDFIHGFLQGRGAGILPSLTVGF